MTAEERKTRMHDLNDQANAIRREMSTLQKEQNHQEQQDCLLFVGRAFKSESNAILITSVPPIEMRMTGEQFNPYQFPCIIVDLRDNRAPIFDDTCFIKGGVCYGATAYSGAYKEITYAEFQQIFDNRMNVIFNMALTAKERQRGKTVFTFGHGDICEK